MKFVVYVFVFVLFVIPILLYRGYYPRAVSAILVQKGKSSLVSVKPNKRFFRNLTLGSPSSFVSLGPGYYAVNISNGDDSMILNNNITIPSGIYIFSRTKLGRFRSVDLSDRCLSDVLSKFK